MLSTSQVLAVGMFSSICAFLFEDWEKLFSVALWTNSSFLFALFLTSLFATSIAFSSKRQHKTYISNESSHYFRNGARFAALTGVLVANEHLSISAIIGCPMYFLGMVFVELPSKTKEAQAA